ncbi:MAG: LLM class flavin-dependent oxidoreductase [Candidatus Geothermarchaeales archaeon]
MTEFAVYLNQYLTEESRAQGYDIMRSQAALLEKTGFDAAFVGERHLYEEGFLNPLACLSLLVLSTTKLKVGTSILILPLYHPIHIAEFTADLDMISRGRVALGVGLGYRKEELQAFGVSGPAKARRFEESLIILRRLLAGERVTFHGEHYDFDDIFISSKPFQKPHPPILVGGSAPPAIERAARLGDGYASGNTSLNEFKRRIAIYRDTLKKIGKDPDSGYVSFFVDGFCSKDYDEAKAVMEAPLLAQYERYTGWGYKKVKLVFDELQEGKFAVGSPEDCIERIEPFIQAGADTIIIRTEWAGMRQEDVHRSITNFAMKVLPYFRE